MATQFDFLSQAKPASLYKLMEKLSMADAAVVLTGLPHNLAIQTLAFYPDERQAPLLSAMRDARGVSAELRDQTALKIHGMLDAAKSARDGKAPAASRPAAPAVGAVPESVPAERSFSTMDPASSILTGSVPEVVDDAPARPAGIPLTPKFTPPRVTAQKSQMPAVPPSAQSAPVPRPAPGAPGHPSQALGVYGAGASGMPVQGGYPEQAEPGAPGAPQSASPQGVVKPQNFKAGHNPYDSAPPPADLPDADTGEHQPNSGELIGQAISDLGAKIKKVFTPPARRDKEPAKAKAADADVGDGFRTRDPAAGRSTAPGARKKPEPRPADFGTPVPWVPRTASTSPINGPAVPGKPPPVVGDPFQSPLAQAGLLDLIGRAQEKFMPKGTVRPESSGERTVSRERPSVPLRKPGMKLDPRTGKPEPMEGVLGAGKVRFDPTPRVIGPRPNAEELVGDDRFPASGAGARRMDGKAILAAILRNSTPEIRETVAGDDPKLFKELRGRMFFFDDLIYTEAASLARVFTAAPVETAALALKFAAPKLRDRVLAAVSPGRAKALRDTPPRAGLDDIELAQKQVLNVALQLQAAGRILIDPRDPDLAGG